MTDKPKAQTRTARAATAAARKETARAAARRKGTAGRNSAAAVARSGATKPSKAFKSEDSRATPKPSAAKKKTTAKSEDSRATPKPSAAKKKTTAKQSFGSTYAAARKKYLAGKGDDVFTWNGKRYSVASKDDLKKGRAKKTKQGYKMLKKS